MGGGERTARGGGLAGLSCVLALFPQFICGLMLLSTLDFPPQERLCQQDCSQLLTLNSTATNTDIQKAIRIIIDRGGGGNQPLKCELSDN